MKRRYRDAREIISRFEELAGAELRSIELDMGIREVCSTCGVDGPPIEVKRKKLICPNTACESHSTGRRWRMTPITVGRSQIQGGASVAERRMTAQLEELATLRSILEPVPKGWKSREWAMGCFMLALSCRDDADRPPESRLTPGKIHALCSETFPDVTLTVTLVSAWIGQSAAIITRRAQAQGLIHSRSRADKRRLYRALGF